LNAFTRQKYFVSFASFPAGTIVETAVIPELSNAVEPNSESVETCILYDIAFVTEFHIKVGVIDIPVVPLAGDDKTGAIGADMTVVNLNHTEKFPQPA